MTTSFPQREAEPAPNELAAVIDRLDNTAVVVSTAAAGRLSACLATYVTAASKAPRRLLVLTSPENLTHELIDASGVLAVNVVGRPQARWVHRFGHVSGRDVDKLADLDWEPGITGSPLLGDALGYVEGRVIASLDCGDHTARLVDPVSARLRRPEAVPLTVLEIFGTGVEPASADPAPPWPAIWSGTFSPRAPLDPELTGLRFAGPTDRAETFHDRDAV